MTKAGGSKTTDEALRKQCLEWAFEYRAASGVWHMNVINVAAEYFAFIKGTARVLATEDSK